MENYGHETRVVKLPDDYEGPVTATVVSLRAEPPSASAVLYVHGYLDYYFQYHMGRHFAGHGRNFYALDLRKYGRSWMPHQHFNYCRRMEEYFPEMDAAIDVILADGNTDITLIGHSTGGLLSALYCAEGARRGFINRLILNSPFLEFNTGWFVRRAVIPVAGALSLLFPYAKVRNVLSPNYFKSVHASRYGEWEFDTRWKPEQAPPLYLAWLRAVRLAQRSVHRGLGLPIPVLVMFSDRSTYHKRWHEEASMQSVIRFIHEHYYDIFIPVTALALLRLAMCFAQLKRTAAIRRKKGVYHSVRDAYAEIGAWLGMLPFLALALAVPAFWPVWAALIVAGGIVVGKLGRKKGLETDDIYREVARELKHEAEAEAAREAASHTLDSGTDAIGDGAETHYETENTEDKGEHDNG